MPRHQQIAVLVLAVLISIGLVVGAYMKRRSGAETQTPVTTEAPGIVKSQPKPRSTPPKPVTGITLREQPKPLPPNRIYRGNPVVESMASVRTVIGQMRLLSVSITAAIMRKRMGYEHLESLDFSQAAADSGSDWAVFNPKGVVMFRGMMNKWIDQELLDQVTSAKGQAVWFSLRRQQSAEAVIDVLYGIIPFPSKGLCETTRIQVSLPENLQLANDNGQVIEDRLGYIPVSAAKSPSCLFTPDKKSYWVYPLRSRLLQIGRAHV